MLKQEEIGCKCNQFEVRKDDDSLGVGATDFFLENLAFGLNSHSLSVSSFTHLISFNPSALNLIRWLPLAHFCLNLQT